MFLHMFKYTFKTIIRNVELIFWIFIFPLILSTLFKFAFSNLLVGESFETIPLAIINNQSYQQNESFKEAIQSVKSPNSQDLAFFQIQETDMDTAKNLLNEDKIVGYINLENEIKLVTSKNGYQQTIIKSFLDQYQKITKVTTDVMMQNPNAIQQGLLQDLTQNTTYLEDISKSKTYPDTSVIYFYTIIGMMCMYASFIGMNTITRFQANCSTLACRNAIAPMHKLKSFLYSMSASFAVQCIVLATLFVYMIVVLNINFGTDFIYMAITSMIGSITGLFFGSMVGALVNKSEAAKMAICVSVTMLCSMLSGMMSVTMKYYMDTTFPMISKLNPVRLITDSLYSLYYYTGHVRLFENLTILSVISILFISITFYVIRRQKYASI